MFIKPDSGGEMQAEVGLWNVSLDSMCRLETPGLDAWTKEFVVNKGKCHFIKGRSSYPRGCITSQRVCLEARVIGLGEVAV